MHSSNFTFSPFTRPPNVQKCPNKYNFLNEIACSKLQNYEKYCTDPNTKKSLDFNNVDLNSHDKTPQFLTLKNQQMVFSKEENKKDPMKTINYPPEGYEIRKIPRNNSVKHFEHSLNQFEISTSNTDNIFENSEAREIYNPGLVSTRLNQRARKKPCPQTNKFENVFRLFTGSVENILFWSKLKKDFQILFEVTATLEDVHDGKWKCEKILTLGDSKTSPKLLVHFYEIDRKLPKLQSKSTVTCIGKFISGNRLQAYKVKQSSEKDKTDCQRLAFICNRTAEMSWINQKVKHNSEES